MTQRRRAEESRAKAGEEIVSTRHRVSQARLVPPVVAAQREAAPLAHLGLPGDLFNDNTEQAAVDDGDGP